MLNIVCPFFFLTDDVVNPCPGMGQAQKGGGVKSVNGHPQLLI
jgi:hypothetical protein